jgi:hypothetical protein
VVPVMLTVTLVVLMARTLRAALTARRALRS